MPARRRRHVVHQSRLCRHVDRYRPHGAAPGGSFALNPDGTLNWGLIEDFAEDGIHQQHVWGVKLAKTYYGAEPVRKYWMGCSTGGRQGHYPGAELPDRTSTEFLPARMRSTGIGSLRPSYGRRS